MVTVGSRNKADRKLKAGRLCCSVLKRELLILAKQSEPLDIVWSSPLPDDAKILNLTISRDTSGRYFVSILVETEIKPLRKTKAEVGIDVGIKTLATTSDGEEIENPRPLVKNEKRLRILQRRLARKVKDSNNRLAKREVKQGSFLHILLNWRRLSILLALTDFVVVAITPAPEGRNVYSNEEIIRPSSVRSDIRQ